MIAAALSHFIVAAAVAASQAATPLDVASQTMPANQLNTWFVGCLLVVVMVAVQLAVGIKTLRRTPPVGEEIGTLRVQVVALNGELASAKASLASVVKLGVQFESINASLEAVHERLAAGDEIISKLREKQAANAEAIGTIKLDAHETRTQVARLAEKYLPRQKA